MLILKNAGRIGLEKFHFNTLKIILKEDKNK